RNGAKDDLGGNTGGEQKQTASETADGEVGRHHKQARCRVPGGSSVSRFQPPGECFCLPADTGGRQLKSRPVMRVNHPPKQPCLPSGDGRQGLEAGFRRRGSYPYFNSKRSKFITLSQAATKSCTNFCSASAQP